MARPKSWTLKFEYGIQEVRLSSWKYFHNYLQQSLIESDNYLYRGQQDGTWKVEPTLIRVCREYSHNKYSSVLKTHLNNFKFSIRGRARNLKDIIDNDDELWALGQHFGLSTPLLDFTDSPYVSAYFAFQEKNNSSQYRVIYGLSKNAVESKLKTFIEYFKPLSDNNQRLISQGGSFIKFKSEVDIESLIRETYSKDEKLIKLYKILIPNKDRELCLKFLNNMNINHNTLFPDLIGASIFCNTKLEIQKY
jgi:hypothetical protein